MREGGEREGGRERENFSFQLNWLWVRLIKFSSLLSHTGNPVKIISTLHQIKVPSKRKKETDFTKRGERDTHIEKEIF